MKNREKQKTKKKKSKGKWYEFSMNVFAIVGLAAAFILIIWSFYRDASHEKQGEERYLASLPAVQDTIAHSKVCMVDDFYQGDFPTVAVSLNNTIYYGCSRKAARDLTTIDSLRFAVDPVTKKKVDKGAAIIAIHPDRDGKVVYFGSQETYNKYLSISKSYEPSKSF